MAEKRGYGVGLQYFPNMIESQCVYIDKTEYIWRMVKSKGRNFFLSRPRRFGKSLLVSTLQAYFEGRKELFEGLYISKVEKEWAKYPVIHLDMSNGKYYDLDGTQKIIDWLLKQHEKTYGLTAQADDRFSNRMSNIIQAAYMQTGRQVVVLIDEYDAPMLDSINKPELQEQIRERMRDLFSPLKAQEAHLRMVFLTGISKFSQLSVFSELNNLQEMTFDPQYEAICGITEEELLTTMKPDIEWLAEAMSRWKPMTYDDTVQELKRMYDGYHFSRQMTDIYNPWSLVSAFERGDIQNFWFSTGTPSSLISLLRKRNVQMPELEGIVADTERFNAPTERITDPIPVLFQSGYLTLKAYDAHRNRFTLGFPNKEVYEGFGSSLYRYYCEDYIGSKDLMKNAYDDLRFGDTDMRGFLESTRKWYKGIPYSITSKNQNEQFYQALFYALLVACGADVQAESQTSDGRMDIALKMQDAIYIFEFKYDKSVEEAMEQIERKDYAVLFAADPRPVYAVGLNISKDCRTIDSYEVTQCK